MLPKCFMKIQKFPVICGNCASKWIDDKDLIVHGTKPFNMLCHALEVCSLRLGIFFLLFQPMLSNKSGLHTVGLHEVSHETTTFHLLFVGTWVEVPSIRGEKRGHGEYYAIQGLLDSKLQTMWLTDSLPLDAQRQGFE